MASSSVNLCRNHAPHMRPRPGPRTMVASAGLADREGRALYIRPKPGPRTMVAREGLADREGKAPYIRPRPGPRALETVEVGFTLVGVVKRLGFTGSG
jgi:hypothetical protein